MKFVKWSPLPSGRSWGVHEADGRIIRRFDTAAEAVAYLNKVQPLTEDQRNGGARFEKLVNPEIDY